MNPSHAGWPLPAVSWIWWRCRSKWLASPCPKVGWRQTCKSSVCVRKPCMAPTSLSATSIWKTLRLAATRPKKSRCAAPWCSPMTNADETRLVRQGQALPAQSMLPPQIYSHEPELRSEAGASDPARAQALLDLYGYDKRDAEGYRLNPDGSPLTLRRAGSETARRPPTARAVEKEDGRGGTAHAVRDRHLRRADQKGLGRPADDLGLRLEHGIARWRLCPEHGLWAKRRSVE